jgi:hypothetical protein
LARDRDPNRNRTSSSSNGPRARKGKIHPGASENSRKLSRSAPSSPNSDFQQRRRRRRNGDGIAPVAPSQRNRRRTSCVTRTVEETFVERIEGGGDLSFEHFYPEESFI